MRKIRSGRLNGAAPLTEAQIERLDAIHMDWLDTYTRQWEYGYKQALAYHREFGTLEVPAGYVNANGFPLGRWLKNHVEVNSQTGRTAIKVTPERRAKLDALGFKWTAEDPWQKRISACEEYLREHGDLDIPPNYVIDNVWLGKWLYKCRKTYRGELEGKSLTEEQISQLERLGIDWRTPAERAWSEKYEAAASLLKTEGDIKTAAGSGEAEEIARIARWVARQRRLHKQGKLSPEQAVKLNALNTRQDGGRAPAQRRE